MKTPSQRGKANKNKGKRGESECAAEWQKLGIPATVGRLQAKGGEHLPDVVTLDGLHCETKRQETMSFWKWFKQAEVDKQPGAIPMVCWKRNRSDWMLAFKLEDLLQVTRLVSEFLGRKNDAV